MMIKTEISLVTQRYSTQHLEKQVSYFYLPHGASYSLAYGCVELPLKAPIFIVPYPQNPQFTGRSDVLTAIHNHLVVYARPGFTASYALHGLGGVGKTQIAIQYAYEHKSDFDLICWLRANDWNTLVNSYVQLSKVPEFASLGIPSSQEGQDHVDVAERMKIWF